jgi:hypothetical protein
VLLARKLRVHSVPIAIAVLLVIGFAIWQFVASRAAGRTVTGGSLVGLISGSVAAAIILFELLLWPRKRLRRWKLFPTKFWMSAHLWLGLATGPLAWIHSGYRLGGTFPAILMTLLGFVLLSGIYGWIMQCILPKWMLNHLPFETIGSQIDDVSIQSALEARRLLTVAYGPKPEGLAKLVDLDEISAAMRGSSMQRDTAGNVKQIIIGAIQRRGESKIALLLPDTHDFNPIDGKEIWRQYAAVIEPFLLHGVVNAQAVGITFDSNKSPIRSSQKTADWFQMFQSSCSPHAGQILTRLQGMCDQRHQFDAQRRAQAWLHGWIAFHASISVLLGALLVTHIFLALKFR